MAKDFGNNLATASVLPSGKVSSKVGGKKDKADFFRFSLSRRSNVSGVLSKLSNNADLVLLNSSGKVVLRSNRPGKNRELINATLEAGNYFVKVAGKSKVAKYQLSLKTAFLDGTDGGTNTIKPPKPPVEPPKPPVEPPVPPPNTPPVLSVNAGTTLARGTQATISSALLKATDAEQSAAQLTYKLDDAPENGTLLLNGVTLKSGSTFTQAAIDNNSLAYKNLPKSEAIAAGGLVDVLEVKGSGVFVAERNGGLATLKFKDVSTGKAETLSPNVDYVTGNASVLSLANGDIDGSNAAWTESGQLFYYNSETSAKPVNISAKLPVGFSGNNFDGLDGSNVIFESFDGNDYELFLFKGATGTLERLTDNADDDIGMVIKDNTVAWRSKGAGSLYDVYAYDITKGNPIQNAVNLTPNSLFGSSDADAFVAGVSGKNVVISATDPNGFDSELFFSNGSGNPTRLTTNNVQDTFAGIDGNIVVWTTGGSGSDLEIAVQDATTGTVILTQNDVDDVIQEVDGKNIVWSAADADGINRLYYRNGTGAVVPLTQGQPNRTGTDETFLGMDGVNVAWESFVNGANQLFFRNLATGTVKQITNQTAGSSPNFGEISGSNLLYSIGDGIFLADGNTGSSTTVATSGGSFQGFGKSSGFNVAWSSPTAGGEQGLFGNFAPKDGFGFAVADGAGGSTSGTFNITLG